MYNMYREKQTTGKTKRNTHMDEDSTIQCDLICGTKQKKLKSSTYIQVLLIVLHLDWGQRIQVLINVYDP